LRQTSKDVKETHRISPVPGRGLKDFYDSTDLGQQMGNIVQGWKDDKRHETTIKLVATSIQAPDPTDDSNPYRWSWDWSGNRGALAPEAIAVGAAAATPAALAAPSCARDEDDRSDGMDVDASSMSEGCAAASVLHNQPATLRRASSSSVSVGDDGAPNGVSSSEGGGSPEDRDEDNGNVAMNVDVSSLSEGCAAATVVHSPSDTVLAMPTPPNREMPLHDINTQQAVAIGKRSELNGDPSGASLTSPQKRHCPNGAGVGAASAVATAPSHNASPHELWAHALQALTPLLVAQALHARTWEHARTPHTHATHARHTRTPHTFGARTHKHTHARHTRTHARARTSTHTHLPQSAWRGH
jgi:hypothetical protein